MKLCLTGTQNDIIARTRSSAYEAIERTEDILDPSKNYMSEGHVKVVIPMENFIQNIE